MKKNRLFLFLSILSLGLSIFFCIKIAVYRESFQGNRIQNDISTDIIESIKEDYLFQYAIDKVHLEEKLLIIDEHDKSFLLKDVVGDRSKLIVFHNNNGCTPCIENVLAPIMSNFQGKNYEDIIFLTTAPKSRDIIIFKNTYNYTGKIFRIAHECLPVSLSEAKGTVLFMVDNSLDVFCVFQANKNTPEITRSYLGVILKRFF